MSTVERDLAAYERRMEREDARDAAIELARENAMDALDDGHDYGHVLRQSDVDEVLSQDDEFWRLVQRMWSAENDYDIKSSSREFRSHCRALIELQIKETVTEPEFHEEAA